MELVVFDKDGTFIISGVSNDDFIKWEEFRKNADAANVDLYVSSYKQALGIPDTLPSDFEQQYLNLIYGSNPLENPVFVSNVQLAKEIFDSKKHDVVNPVKWFSERGADVRSPDAVIEF